MIGRTLSHYKILSEISRGGMGIVYRAVDVKLDREVALKVLPPDLVADPERKRRFVQEGKAAAKLEHPHIGVVYEIDETDGVSFIAMELIRGEQLRDTIARGPVPLRRALEIATDVAEGLAKAHDEGIAHRDLKPANIMVTEEGHAKIIDFGLAKLVESRFADDTEETTALRDETSDGKILGTVSYMSPEQARGQNIDHRTDVFSFGIVLHEMVTGEAPFRGPTGADTLNAILSGPTPQLPSLGADVSDQAAFELQHVLEKCLNKEPNKRYQTIKDAVIDLHDVSKRLESGPITTTVATGRRKPLLYTATGAIAALTLVGTLLVLRPPVQDELTPSPTTRPSVAILLFDNISGDPSLDWLRLGLAEMLVTDLSQSPNLEVFSTDRLYQILEDMNRLDQRITSLEVVQEVADKIGANTVILGSFMKSGSSIRINVRVQDASSGKILTTEKVEGEGDSSIFPMVNDLTRRVSTSLGGQADAIYWDMNIANVTTDSIEAFRYYVEGRKLQNSQKGKEAVALFEKAIEVDPGFAMALSKLWAIHSNLGNTELFHKYARLALEHADRLPPRERYYVEGNFYFPWPTMDRSIDAYREALRHYPDHKSARQNLALGYWLLERYDEAIELIEDAIEIGQMNDNSFWILAECYDTQGRPERAYRALQELLRRRPDIAGNHYDMGHHLITWGKLDDALQAFQKAEALWPEYIYASVGRWQVSMLRGNWELADAATGRILDSNEPYPRWSGLLQRAVTRLYHGQSREAVGHIEKANQSDYKPKAEDLGVHSFAAHVLLEKGDVAQALEQAKKDSEEREGHVAEWEGLFYVALVQGISGRMVDAEKTAERLLHTSQSPSTVIGLRLHHHLAGELALLQGNIPLAIDELHQAISFLPERGIPSQLGGVFPRHVPIWFSLAKANLAAGDDEEATEWLQRITESTTERLWWPIPYVRSFYFLGKIHENRDEMEKAREYYRRFYEYWKDGDMDRERVDEARKKLAS